MISWWIDINDDIVRVGIDIHVFSRPDISFDGADAKFISRQTFSYGNSYIYQIGDNTLCINVVNSKGERFVSLYLNRKLIKEYNIHAQKYAALYNSLPGMLDSKRRFALVYLLPKAILAAFVFAFLFASVACLLPIVGSLYEALVTFLALVAINFVWLFLLGLVLFAILRTRLRHYEIISSIKKSIKRKKRKKSFRHKVRL